MGCERTPLFATFVWHGRCFGKRGEGIAWARRPQTRNNERNRMKIPPLMFLVLGLAETACAHAPQAYSFTIDRPQGDLDTVARILTQNGLAPTSVDRQGGIITTRWVDTGYRFRESNEIDDGPYREYETNVFLRYRVSIQGTNGKDIIVLETDVQRCSAIDSVITAEGVSGTCRPMSVLFPAQQEQTAQLGEKLRLGLAAKPKG